MTDTVNAPLTPQDERESLNAPNCASPFCGNPKGNGKFCSSKCRLDGWAIRRAAQLLDRVGAVEFFEIVSRSRA